MFTVSDLRIVRFCAEECDRQQSGEISVANMVDAWDFARAFDRAENWKPRLVLELGRIVEPKRNEHGYRLMNVTIDGQPVPWVTIPDNIDRLMSSIDWRESVMAEEFYQHFERIHPFTDGNGRVGAVLYNMLLGTMDDPKTPPEFKR